MKSLISHYKDAIKYCILNGIWYLNSNSENICKYDMHYADDMIIDSISHLDKDFYMVRIYYKKLDTESCFENGYQFTTNRTVKLSDVLGVDRTLKLKKIISTI